MQSLNGWRKNSFIIMVILFAIILSCTISYAGIKHPKGEKVYGEIKNDQALVYILDLEGLPPGLGSYIYSNENFLVYLTNNTYGITYLNPGIQLIWSHRLNIYPQKIEFLPGQTYYIRICANSISLFSDAAGKAILEQMNYYLEPDDKDKKNAAQKIAKGYESVQKIEAKKMLAQIPEYTIQTPQTTEGLYQIPALSQIKLQLMEDLSTAQIKTGARVNFKVIDDLIIDNQLCIKNGTMVEGVVRYACSKKTRGYGILDLVIPGVLAADGTMIPVVGQIITNGTDRIGEARVVGAFFGILGSALVQSGEAELKTNEEIIVLTRNDCWIDPAKIENNQDTSIESNNPATL